MITVNGKTCPCTDGLCLKAFLDQSGYEHSRVAVELNGEIVPKDAYETRTLKDGDRIEIVCFVGGG